MKATMKRIENPALLAALQNARQVMVCGHVSPDGDAVGSVLAMGAALRGMGKQVTMALQDAVPENLSFLPGTKEIVNPDALDAAAFDTVVVLDVASVERMGSCKRIFEEAPCTVLLDHHMTNPGYAMHNEVDGNAAATGSVVMRVLRALEIPITEDMAACLYAAISTDTGNFCFKNTDEEAFACASELMKTGFDLSGLARQLHLLRGERHLRLLGRAIASLRIFAEGKAACVRLTAADYEAAGALPEDSDKIVNYAMDLVGVQMAYLADSREAGTTKVSLRAQPGFDVACIAQQLGGGGHMLASGAHVQQDMETVCAFIEGEMIKQFHP